MRRDVRDGPVGGAHRRARAHVRARRRRRAARGDRGRSRRRARPRRGGQARRALDVGGRVRGRDGAARAARARRSPRPDRSADRRRAVRRCPPRPPRRRTTPRRCVRGAEQVLRATGARARAATASRTPSRARRRRATATCGTGTRAFTRSRGASSTPRAPAPSCERCCARGARTASSRTRCSGTRRPAGGARRCTRRAGRSATAARRRSGRRCWRSRGSSSRTPRPTRRRFAPRRWPPLAAHLRWLEHHRDPDGDGLLSIVTPDESGLDDSPKYAPVFGRLTHDRAGYALLMERGRRARWDSRTLIARYDHHVEDVWVNVAYALSLHAMARLSGDAAWAARAARVERALLERCLDERTGLFFDLAGRDERPVRISTWSALSPLVLPGLPRGRAPAARRGAPARRAPLPRAVRDPVGEHGGAGVQPALGPLPHVARAVVGQHRVAARAGDARARLRARGGRRRRLARQRRAARRAFASTTTRCRGRGSARAGSAGRRCWRTCSPPARRPRRARRGSRAAGGRRRSGPRRRCSGEPRARQRGGEPDRLVDRDERVLRAVPELDGRCRWRRARSPTGWCTAGSRRPCRRPRRASRRGSAASRALARPGASSRRRSSRGAAAYITPATSRGLRRASASSASPVARARAGLGAQQAQPEARRRAQPGRGQRRRRHAAHDRRDLDALGQRGAHASAYGPPADTPTTAKRGVRRARRRAARRRPRSCGSVRPGSGSESPKPGRLTRT